jgi:lysophospholipase L1-like esterase
VPELEWALRRCRPDLDISVINLGRGGEDTAAGLKRIGEVLAARPDIVLAEFATNDAYAPYKVSLRSAAQRTKQLVRAIRHGLPLADIYLMTMNPVIGSVAIAEHPRLPEYFAGYRKLQRQLGLKLIDIEPIWGTPPPASIPDGTHPTLEAHLGVTVPAILTRLREDHFT